MRCCLQCRFAGRIPTRDSVIFPLKIDALMTASNSPVARLHEAPRVCSICGSLWCEPRDATAPTSSNG
jgi:hypothetical protein